MTRSKSTKLTLSGAASLLALSFAVGNANAEEKKFDIEAQPLAKALLEFNEQSGLTVAAPRDLVQDKNAPAVRGEMEPDVALEKILSGSGLKSNELPTGAYTITLASVEVTEPPAAPFRVAQLDQEETVREVGRRDEEAEEARQDVIVVTGTNIRGIAQESSPSLSFDREAIENSGAATAQGFIQLLPQNFSGGSNAEFQFGVPGDINGSLNTGVEGSLGSSVNLRGLGSGSTLVLLNGNRLAPSSGIGEFVDISMIPASAIERIEVLTDGASSIYGGDAVAGVVNFILRDDFDGVEASYRYGTVTEGDLSEHRASLLAGKSWDSGHALMVYEFFEQGNLSAADRTFSEASPLPNDLLPSQQRHSVLASASQELSSALEVFADFTFSTRESEQFSSTGTGFMVRSNPSTENLNVSAGAAWQLSYSWFADFSGTYSEVQSETDASGGQTGKRDIGSKIWTADAKVSGDVFKIPGGDVKVAFGGHYRTEDFSNFDLLTDTIDREADREVYAAFGEVFVPIVGPGNALPGIERLELNVSGRFEDYSDFGSTANPKVGVLWAPVEPLRLRGSYSTSFNPPPLGRVGATDRSGTAVRTSFVNLILGTTSPDPSLDDVVVLNVAGTGQNLDAETSTSFTGGFDFSEEWGAHSLSISSTYFNIDFEGRLGRLPIPDGRNPFEAPYIAFENPGSFPVGSILFSPSQSVIDQVLGSLDSTLNFPGADAANPDIISFVSEIRNLARTEVSGIDFNVNYNYSVASGVYALGLSGTFIDTFDQLGSTTTPVVDQLNTLFKPVDLRMRGNIGYSNDTISANLFVNYADSYRSDNTATSVPIDAWTTVDANLSYNTREKFDNVLDNTVLRLSVINLFDENPPEAPGNPTFGIFGFDPTNANPLGRFVSFEVTKRF